MGVTAQCCQKLTGSAAVVAVIVGLASVSCQSESGDGEASPTITSRGEPRTSAGATSSDTTEPDGPQPDPGCDTDRTVDGDFDGDGTIDLASVDADSATLTVCTASGTTSLTDAGSADLLVAADLDGNGRDEILIGATTAWGVGMEVVALTEGALDYVRVPAGDPMALWHGLPPEGFLTTGCGRFRGGDELEIAVIEGSIDEAGIASWQRTVFRLDDHRAVVVSTDEGSFDPASAPDPLSTAEVDELDGDPCWDDQV